MMINCIEIKFGLSLLISLLVIITTVSVIVFKASQFTILANVIPVFILIIIMLGTALIEGLTFKRLIFFLDSSFLVLLFYGLLLKIIGDKSEYYLIGWEAFFILYILLMSLIVIVPLNIIYFVRKRRVIKP